MRIKKKHSIAFLVITVVVLLLVACGSNAPLTVRELAETREATVSEAQASATTAAAERADVLGRIAPEGTEFADTPPDRGHDSNLTIPFEDVPPDGGAHNPTWQLCKVYDKPVKPEYGVHALEHGAVWITYQPDLDADSVDKLGDYQKGEPFVMVSPYPNLGNPIVLTAWGLRLSVDSADDARIQEFIDAFANGPQTPEPGASCSTGIQDTVDFEQ